MKTQTLNSPLTASVLKVNQENFKSTIECHPFVLISFGASWCQPCERFAPVFEHVATTFPSWQFAVINIDQSPELSAYFNVKQVPCLMAIRQGIVIDTVIGEMKVHELSHHVQMWTAFNMTEIEAHFDAKAIQ